MGIDYSWIKRRRNFLGSIFVILQWLIMSYLVHVFNFLSKWISKLKNRRFTYRVIFVPETIGSISYLSKNHKKMKEKVIAGF